MVERVVRGYLLLVLMFFFLFIFADLSFKLQDILKAKAPFGLVLDYYLCQLPRIFVWVSPLAFLLSSFYHIGTLTRNNEIIALRTQGISIFQISRIFIVLAFLLSVVSLVVQEKSAAFFFKKSPNALALEKENLSENSVIENFAFYSSSNYIVFARQYYPQKGRFLDVTIFRQNDSGELLEEIIGQELFFEKTWVIRNAIFYKMQDKKLVEEENSVWEERVLLISEKPDEIRIRKNAEWDNFSLRQLQKEAQKFALWKTNKITQLIVIEMHRKMAESFSMFFLMLGGLPFALRIRQRKVGLSSLGLSVVLCFAYYFLFSLSLAFGKTGILFIWWIAPWVPNIFFGVSGVVGILHLR